MDKALQENSEVSVTWRRLSIFLMVLLACIVRMLFCHYLFHLPSAFTWKATFTKEWLFHFHFLSHLLKVFLALSSSALLSCFDFSWKVATTTIIAVAFAAQGFDSVVSFDNSFIRRVRDALWFDLTWFDPHSLKTQIALIGEGRYWWHRWRHWRHRNGSRYTESQDNGRFNFLLSKSFALKNRRQFEKVFLQMGRKYQDCMIQWKIWELSCPKIRVSWFFSANKAVRVFMSRWTICNDE